METSSEVLRRAEATALGKALPRYRTGRQTPDGEAGVCRPARFPKNAPGVWVAKGLRLQNPRLQPRPGPAQPQREVLVLHLILLDVGEVAGCPHERRSRVTADRPRSQFTGRLSAQHWAPIWHSQLTKDGEKLRENQEMIKGVENGHFEDRLKALFSPKERRLGRDLIAVLRNMKGCREGRLDSCFPSAQTKKKRTQTVEDLSQTRGRTSQA